MEKEEEDDKEDDGDGCFVGTYKVLGQHFYSLLYLLYLPK